MKNIKFIILYVAVLVIAAVRITEYSLEVWPFQVAWIVPVLCFTAFMVGVELFEIRTSEGSNWIPSATVDLAVWVTLGPTAAILMEILGVSIGEIAIKRRPPLKVIFNLATMVVSVGVAGITYANLPWADQLRTPLFLVPALLSYGTFTVINTALGAIVIALSDGTRIDRKLRDAFGWHFLSGVFSAPLGAFMIFSYEYAGIWSLVLFALPVLIVYQAHKLFEEMREAHKNTVAALTTALEADEPYTHGHSYRVAQYAIGIGRRLNMNEKELENLEYAGMLHDIGKIAITNDIVCKPARLTKDEFDILSSHPVIGGEIVEQMKFLRDAADLVRHHHERPDGLGYPDGLKNDEISLGSHILNLCDAVDAMCSNRPYRAALTLDQCVEEVQRFRGTQFEVNVVDAFTAMVADGSFAVIAQADGTAQRIQAIIRGAAPRLPVQAA
jgi:putative nucleotidyltransferase with HDIG domain